MNGRPWTQEGDGCVHPVDEDRLFLESPIFHQLMGDRQIDCWFREKGN